MSADQAASCRHERIVDVSTYGQEKVACIDCGAERPLNAEWPDAQNGERSGARSGSESRVQVGVVGAAAEVVKRWQDPMTDQPTDICPKCAVSHDSIAWNSLGMLCGRCGEHTGNNHQGHYWGYCKALAARGLSWRECIREMHFCCPDDCELSNLTIDHEGTR